MNVVRLFEDSSFLFLVNLNCINRLYQFKEMNIVYFVKKLKFMTIYKVCKNKKTNYKKRCFFLEEVYIF